MREWQIECVCRTIRINDLNLNMKDGDVAHVPLDQARNSKDLKAARGAGAVLVSTVERFKERRQPESPKHRVRPMTGPAPAQRIPEAEARATGKQGVPATVVIHETTTNNVTDVDTDALAEKVKNKLAGELGDILRQAVAGIPVIHLPGGSGAARASGSDEPRFIPSQIMSDDLSMDMSVEATATEGDGLDDAAAALSAIKGNKKKKKG